MIDAIVLYVGFGAWTASMVRYLDDSIPVPTTAKASRVDLLLMSFFAWPLILGILFGPMVFKAVREKTPW